MADEDFDVDAVRIRSSAMDAVKTPAPNPFSRAAAPSPAAKAAGAEARRTPVLHTPAPGAKRTSERPPVNPFSRSKVLKQDDR